MKFSTRRSICALLGIFVCILLYNIIRSKTKEETSGKREARASQNKNSMGFARRQRDSWQGNHDNNDHTVTRLRKQAAMLREQLAMLKQKCQEPGRFYFQKKSKPDKYHRTHGGEQESEGTKWKNRDKIVAGFQSTKTAESSSETFQYKTLIKSSATWNYKSSRSRPKNFWSFTKSFLYGFHTDIRPRSQFTGKIIGKNGEYRHLHLAVLEASAILRKSLNLSKNENVIFERGVFGEDANFGTEYEFHCLVGKQFDRYSVRFIRPYSRLVSIQKPIRLSNSKNLVNIIVPLAGRVDTFRRFLETFSKICILKKENVFLTVVFNGDDSLSEAKKLLWQLEKQHGFRDFRFIHKNQEFSRGRALHEGVMGWKRTKDVLMFFCDVDIVFDSGFLERCRAFSEPGRKVYYPILFNLYNPKYAGKTATGSVKISKQTGFWRYYGRGMTCQYQSDYFRVGGFNLAIKGWGHEDVQLYHKYLKRSDIRVIRAPDEGLFHHYHPKHCDTTLPSRQYRDCIKTKIASEASQVDFGRRVFELERSSKEP